jgi:large subunit ribosomal protein L19
MAEATETKKIRNTMESVEKEILEAQNNNGKFPEFAVGDTVKVYVKIIEGDKQRLQPFEGMVLGFQNGGPRRSFIVRRISYGVAIERVFPFHSPFLEKIEVVRKGKVRRAKLYYMRGRFGRSAVVAEKV